MDKWGILIFCIAGTIAYFVSNKYPGLARLLLFVSGVGLGIVIGAIWSYAIVMSLL